MIGRPSPQMASVGDNQTFKPVLEFKDEETPTTSGENEDSISPDTAIVKMEKFDVDMAAWLSQTQPISAEEKRRIKAMLKKKTLANQFEAKYILGKFCKHDYKGRWIVKGSVGLQGLSRDTRSALAGNYYWDLDFSNCQVEILRQMAEKNGWKHDKLDEYCSRRDSIFADIKLTHDLDRDDIKQMFIRILFGGNRRIGDPAWVNEQFYPEVQLLMKNVCSLNPDLKKKRDKAKTDNPIGSTCAIVLQTEERKCLEALDRVLSQNGRNLAVYIHDGGYVEKKVGEKIFPSELLKICSEFVLEKTGYKLELAVKEIKTSFKLPNKAEIDQNKTYEAVKETFEGDHFKLISESVYVRTSFRKIVKMNITNLIESYRHLKFLEVNPKDSRRVVEHSFIKRWIEDSSIRRYEFMGMYPPPLQCPENTFNSWTGLEIESTPSPDVLTPEILADVKFIEDHIFRLADEKEATYKYILDFIHTLFKYPGKRVNVSLLFKAMSGFGKEWFYKILKAVLGEKYCLITVEVERDLIGEFNGSLDSKLLIVVDEMSAKIGFKYSEKLKTLTTQEKMTVNAKYGRKNDDVPNFIHWLYFADRGFPVEVEAQDRRFCAVHATGDKMSLTSIDRFIRIEKDAAVLRAFYDRMILRPDCDNDWAGRRPSTELMDDLKINSISREFQFIIDYCQDFGPSREVPMKDIFQAYQTFMSESFFGEGVKLFGSISSFGLALKNMRLEGLKRLTSGGRKGTRYLINPTDVFSELKQRRILDIDYVVNIPHKRLLKEISHPE
jgi:hypothetical protein